MITGVDSEFPPSTAQAAQAWSEGFRFWGLYVAGSSAANIWPVGAEQICRVGGFLPLPICVPNQSFTESPVSVAQDTINACQVRGILSGGIVLDAEHSANTQNLLNFWDVWAPYVGSSGYVPELYNGPHLTWPPPTWEPTDTPNPPDGCAVQCGSTDIAGLSVDLDFAADNFPLGSWDVLPPPPIPPGVKMITSQLVNGLPQIFYIAATGVVVQLDIINGQWTWTPISSQAGAPLAAT